MLRELPDHPDSVEKTGKQFWDLLWRGCFQLLAWVVKTLKELKVILSLDGSCLDVLRDVLETFDVLTVDVCQDLQDSLA